MEVDTNCFNDNQLLEKTWKKAKNQNYSMNVNEPTNLAQSSSKLGPLPSTSKQAHLQNNQPTHLIEALTGLLNTYSKNEKQQQQHQQPHQAQQFTRGKRPHQRKRVPKEGHASGRTLKKRQIYRKNRHKQRHIQQRHTCYAYYSSWHPRT